MVILLPLQVVFMSLNIRTPKIINFPFGTNGKLMVLGVPIPKYLSFYRKLYLQVLII